MNMRSINYELPKIEKERKLLIRNTFRSFNNKNFDEFVSNNPSIMYLCDKTCKYDINLLFYQRKKELNKLYNKFRKITEIENLKETQRILINSNKFCDDIIFYEIMPFTNKYFIKNI